MTNEIDFSEWNPDRLETDGEDLMRTIYKAAIEMLSGNTFRKIFKEDNE